MAKRAIFHIPLEDPNAKGEPKSASQIGANDITWIMDSQIDPANTNHEYHYATYQNDRRSATFCWDMPPK